MPVIDTDGQRVSYSDTGNGVTVVFVPGLGGSKDWFCYQASGLSDHYRVISYDLRRARGRLDYTVPLLADDLARLLSALRVRSAVVAGHALGGLVAMRFATIHPEKCLLLVLSSTAPAYPKLANEELISHTLPGSIRSDGFIARLWRGLTGAAAPKEDDSGPLSYLTRTAATTDRRTLSARLRILRETDLTPALDDIAVPALIIAGAQEEPYVLAASQLMEQRIADSTLEVLEGADHYYFYSRHDIFNGIIADYLAHKIVKP